ncbi:Na+/H+ antiporter subunit C [Nitratireductor sp.]|uniref:Na+/H+ antiporter subunit C n=1 Tax=Nitratireductor sp. TaxID=1872084 RepID=UPI002611B829|nr:Na+/H+ antiporter subunit C [Nitratireductor sp.]MCV0348823.1 Na+/H+ antiporter subunit C [Nitratireductor sp.]
MEAALAFVVSVFFAVAIYLMLSKHIIRILLGVSIFGNAVNLSIFTAGRLMREVPPIIPEALQTPDAAIANPLPQALVLTAIVISFSLFAFLLVLAFRAYQELGTDDTDGMRVAEPEGEPLPPLGY